MSDDHLGPYGRALLDAARPALGPDPDAARRMRAKIAVSVGGGAVAGVAAKSALAAKLGIAGVVAALAIGALVYATRSPAPTPVPPMAPTPVAVAPAVVVPVQEPVEPVEQEMPAVDVSPQRPVAKPAVTEITLAREVELVDHAMASLKQHDARDALASIRIYDIESRGRGQLAEDAAAIEVEATCTLHEPNATARLTAFDQRYPRSSQHGRLAELCK